MEALSCSENVLRLIEAVRKHPLLWDPECPYYKDIKRKAKVWENIAAEFGVDADGCKKKWKRLRDCYVRDRNTVKVSDNIEDDPDIGRWKYAKYLEFLADIIKTRHSTSINLPNIIDISVKQEKDDFEDDEPADDCKSFLNSAKFMEDIPSVLDAFRDIACSSNFNNQFPESASKDFTQPKSSNSKLSRRKRKKKDAIENQLLETMESIQDFCRHVKDSTDALELEDEDDLFFRSIAKQIKKYPTRSKNIFKLQVLSYLNDIENDLHREQGS